MTRTQKTQVKPLSSIINRKKQIAKIINYNSTREVMYRPFKPLINTKQPQLTTKSTITSRLN